MCRSFICILVLLVLFIVGSVNAQHFEDCVSPRDTGSSSHVVVPLDADVRLTSGELPMVGDEIALYTKDGLCAGSAAFDTVRAVVTVAGPNAGPFLPNGYEPGEALKYEFFDTSTGEEHDLGSDAAYTCEGLPICEDVGEWMPDRLYNVTRLGSSDPIPVELASFEAEVVGDEVRFKWKTLSETNNALFVVERDERGVWETIATREGQGTTEEATTYTATARKLRPGDHTFRLRQIDMDGSENVEEETTVRVGLNGRFALSKPYPNPAQGVLKMWIVVAATQEVKVEAFDVLGRHVATVYHDRIREGKRRTIKIDPLPSGRYFFRVTGDQFSTHRSGVFVR
jgi:hypothetical protein